MEFERFWNDFNKTKITKYYLLSVLAVTFCITYIKPLNAFYYLCLSFDHVQHYFQVNNFLKISFKSLLYYLITIYRYGDF